MPQVQIQVPAGCGPGSVLQIQWEGQSYQISVPSGVGAGQTIQVNVGAAVQQAPPQAVAAPPPYNPASAGDVTSNYGNEAHVREIFGRYDRNKNGTIDPQELAGMFQELGLSSQFNASKMFLDYDKNRDNMIDWYEFVHLYNRVQQHIRPQAAPTYPPSVSMAQPVPQHIQPVYQPQQVYQQQPMMMMQQPTPVMQQQPVMMQQQPVVHGYHGHQKVKVKHKHKGGYGGFGMGMGAMGVGFATGMMFGGKYKYGKFKGPKFKCGFFK